MVKGDKLPNSSQTPAQTPGGESSIMDLEEGRLKRVKGILAYQSLSSVGRFLHIIDQFL